MYAALEAMVENRSGRGRLGRRVVVVEARDEAGDWGGNVAHVA